MGHQGFLVGVSGTDGDWWSTGWSYSERTLEENDMWHDVVTASEGFGVCG